MPKHKLRCLELVHPDEGEDACLTAVFVHGLGGDSESAWTNTSVDPAFYWPLEMAKDHPKVCFWRLSYAANILKVFFHGDSACSASPGSRSLRTQCFSGCEDRPKTYRIHHAQPRRACR